VPILLDNLPSSLPYIKQGRFIPIVVAAEKRVAALPDVPTLGEVGLPQVNRVGSMGFTAPRVCRRSLGTKSDCATVCYDPSTRRRRRLLLSCRSTFSIAAVRVAWSGCVPNFKASALLTDLNSYVWTNPA
jgi:hypothetical protein